MKISEAKNLQQGDTVFIFIGVTKWEVVVEKSEQLSSQVVQIDVMWLEKGAVHHASRPQTAAYLTPLTAARLASIPGLRPVAGVTHAILDPSAVPADIVRCAFRIENWMKGNNYAHWKLLGIQSRDIV